LKSNFKPIPVQQSFGKGKSHINY